MEDKISNELNEENIAKSELFNELMDSISSDKNIPYIEKNKVLMAPGVWNDCYYSKEEIIKAFEKTDWTDRYNSNLILDHADQRFSDWVGNVENRRLDKDTGYVYGDLYIYDPITSIKLSRGKPKTGISPKVTGDFDDKEKKMSEFTFENFSIVINPAVKKAYMYNKDGSKPVFFSDGGENMSEQDKEKMDKEADTKESDSPAEVSKENEMNPIDAVIAKISKGESLNTEEIETIKAAISTPKDEEENKEDDKEDDEEENKEKPKDDDEEKDEEDKMKQDEEKEKPKDEMADSSVESKMEKSVKEMSQTIKELSEKIKTLEAPEKVTKSGVVAEMSQSKDSDEQMLGFLKGI